MALLDSWTALAIWGIIVLISLSWLIYDLRKKNSHLSSMMNLVWFLTVLYSGPVGLFIYYISGRKQIKKDNIWTKGLRSVSHCYSGCGSGEIAGMFIAAGLLNLNNAGMAITSFTLAYIAGFGMTLGPLIQDGVGFWTAFKDSFYSDTATIAMMEIVAIGSDLWLSAGAGIAEPRFWTALIISLSLGLMAAYPLNVWLVARGVKKGMHNPQHSHH